MTSCSQPTPVTASHGRTGHGSSEPIVAAMLTLISFNTPTPGHAQGQIAARALGASRSK